MSRIDELITIVKEIDFDRFRFTLFVVVYRKGSQGLSLFPGILYSFPSPKGAPVRSVLSADYARSSLAHRR